MRSIEGSYKSIAKQHSSLGTYPNLAKAITDRRFSRKSIVKAFKKLMPEDEYAKDEIKGLIDYLESLSKRLEEVEIRLTNRF